MRYRKFLTLLPLALALAAPAAAQRGPQGVPPGHLPPAGMCRVWFDGRPPGHQPGPTDCATARREAARTGGRVIFGDDREEWWDEDWWNDDQWTSRFDRLDFNGDGFVSRSEWPADLRIFDRLDGNDDNRLSRSEIQNPDFDREEPLEERFLDNDLNRDGRLSPREWWGRDDMFEILDRNGDDFLSLTEVLERNPEDYRLSTRRFHDLDRNRDGRLSEREWSGSLAEFGRRDRNDDGFLSLDEWLRRS